MEIIRQKGIGIETTFEFDVDSVQVKISDRSGEHVYSAPYEELALEDVSQMTLPRSQPTTYMWMAGFPIGFTALRAGYDHPVAGYVLGAVAFALIFVGILARDRKWFVVRLDLVPVLLAGIPKLRILHDRNRQHILDAMAEGRRSVLRRRYVGVNPHTDPLREKRRIDWLLEREIIDEPEHSDAIAQLAAMWPASEKRAQGSEDESEHAAAPVSSAFH